MVAAVQLLCSQKARDIHFTAGPQHAAVVTGICQALKGDLGR